MEHGGGFINESGHRPGYIDFDHFRFRMLVEFAHNPSYHRRASKDIADLRRRE
jgi:hypothetical protein